jgi:hypothetical protein
VELTVADAAILRLAVVGAPLPIENGRGRPDGIAHLSNYKLSTRHNRKRRRSGLRDVEKASP